MTEVKTNKHIKEEPLPLLSLKPRPEEGKKDDREDREQEALWARSLEYFERMKAN